MDKNHGNMRLIILLKFILVTSIVVVGIGNTYGVDTDMSAFSAPYLMVDPETGQLIEVDPSKQPDTTMENAVSNQIATQQDLEQVETHAPSFRIYYLAAALLTGLVIFSLWAVRKHGHNKTSV